MLRIVVPLVLLLSACSTVEDPTDPGPGTGPEAGVAAAPDAKVSASDLGRPGDHGPARDPASVRSIGPALRERMRHSHRPGCPVPLEDLRYLRMRFVGFDGRTHLGEMVLHKDHADAVAGVFEQLYDARWPIQRMQLVDDFHADDNRSMAANNTSGYNCRQVAGTEAWSAHAFGAAIDINPVQNPYVTRSHTRPTAGRRYESLDRSAGARVPVGAIREGDVVVRAFARIGWDWGGRWWAAKDYQHFSARAD